MSYELVNQSTEICRTFSGPFWAKALELARLYGWKPMGTQPPSSYALYRLETHWTGTYLTNDGQVVKSADAYGLARALERSLEKIPDSQTPVDWASKFWLEDDLPEWLSPDEQAMIEEELEEGLLDTIAMQPCDFFAGREKSFLVELIRFCRLGSFEIL